MRNFDIVYDGNDIFQFLDKNEATFMMYKS